LKRTLILFITFYLYECTKKILLLAEHLALMSETLVELSEKHMLTIVPNYTNGVPAQPNGPFQTHEFLQLSVYANP